MNYKVRILIVLVGSIFTGSLLAAQQPQSTQTVQTPQATQQVAQPNSPNIGLDHVNQINSTGQADQAAQTEQAMQIDLLQKHPDLGAGDVTRIVRGFRVAPVPLNISGKDPLLVGLGSYLVNTQGGCNDCHTNPSYAAGGNPFNGEPKRINAQNYLAGGMAFGPFTSRNLTPDTTTGLPAGLTLAQFQQVMRTGVDLKQAHPPISLLQVMPWPLYQDMTDRDLRAMYEYLRAIPHAEPGMGTAAAPAPPTS